LHITNWLIPRWGELELFNGCIFLFYTHRAFFRLR